MNNKQAKSICLLNDSFPPLIDGVSNAVINYAENIKNDGGTVFVVTPQVPGSDDSGFRFPVVRYPSIDTRKLIGYVAGYPFSPEAARMVRESRTELLHLHCPAASALLARQIAESMDLPLVLTWHTKYDIDIANAVRSKLLQEGALQALMRNVNACDEVWAVSRGAGDNLRSLGYEGEIIVMPNGVDLPRGKVPDDQAASATSGYFLPKDVPLLLFVGRLMWYKGIRIILDALSEISAKGLDFRMVFIGKGTDEKEIRKYCSDLMLDDKCLFIGPVYDREALRAWYTRADLFLFPSTFDTNGLVVREAAACDLPAVLIRGSAAAEDVTDDRNAFLIEEDAASMAARLTELLPDKERLQKTGEAAGRELYLSWHDAVRGATERYGAVIDNYKSGKYKKHKTIEDAFFRSQGDLMDVLGQIDARRRETAERMESLRLAVIRDIELARRGTLESYDAAKNSIIAEFEKAKKGIADEFRDIFL